MIFSALSHYDGNAMRPDEARTLQSRDRTRQRQHRPTQCQRLHHGIPDRQRRHPPGRTMKTALTTLISTGTEGKRREGRRKNQIAPHQKFIFRLKLCNCRLEIYNFTVQLYIFRLEINFPSYPRQLFIRGRHIFPPRQVKMSSGDDRGMVE